MSKRKLQLYYQWAGDSNAELEKYLIDNGADFEGFFVETHRLEYDHNDDSLHPKHRGGSCFCEIPDYTNPNWPKLHTNDGDLMAAGVDAIMNFNFENYNNEKLD